MTKPMFQKCIINTLDKAYYYEKIINILRFLKTKTALINILFNVSTVHILFVSKEA